jgi:hypothetical protein
MGGRVECIGEKRNLYLIFVTNPEEKKPLCRSRRTSEDNIKMDLRETGWSGTDSDHLPQDMEQWTALLNTLMNFRISQYITNLLSS